MLDGAKVGANLASCALSHIAACPKHHRADNYFGDLSRDEVKELMKPVFLISRTG